MSDQTNLRCANSIINAWFSADCVLLRFSKRFGVTALHKKTARMRKRTTSDEPVRTSGEEGGSGDSSCSELLGHWSVGKDT